MFLEENEDDIILVEQSTEKSQFLIIPELYKNKNE